MYFLLEPFLREIKKFVKKKTMAGNCCFDLEIQAYI